MIKVSVKTSASYNILIDKGLLDASGELIADVKKPCRTVVVTDTNVEPLYFERVKNSLEKSGFEVVKYTFAAGEKSKSTENFVRMLEFFAENHITRTDAAVALGGGVVGDITGFTSACYLRGIDFVQIPTTLLAAVDSSVGGKTAVDLVHGKNLAGAFHQPILVLCDTDTFSTLPKRETACGYAEIIKYGVCFDEGFFNKLYDGSMEISEIISECVNFKKTVVEKDEFDNGERKLLNFGHTAAHGIETESAFLLTHGEAVGVGMVIASKIARFMGICNEDVPDKVEKILKKYNIPTHFDIDAHTLYEFACSDKKREGGEITLVLPEKIGKCILKKVEVSSLERLFEQGLK